MKSLDKELSSFFTSISDKKYDLTSVTKGALTQSRAKLNHTAFIELSEMAVKDFYLEESYETWKGHRLLAIDGSCLNLPYHEDVINEFGYQYVGSKADIKRSMAKVSSCYDVLNGITLDSQIDGFKVSERVLMTKHFENVAFRRKDILLMDRGYPSIAIFYKLISKGVDFCIRMKTSWWKEVDNFSNSLLQSKVVEFTLPQKDMVLKKDLNQTSATIKVRLVKVPLATGEVEVLATSLLNEKAYTNSDLQQLYHYRWGIEEFYKTLKTKLNLEVFSGKTSRAIKQDYFAKVFMMNMCAIMSFPIRQKIAEENKSKTKGGVEKLKNKEKYENVENISGEGKVPREQHFQKINFSNCLSFIRDSWIDLMTKSALFKKKLIAKLDDFLYKTKDIERVNRIFKRNKKRKQPPAMTYKAI